MIKPLVLSMFLVSCSTLNTTEPTPLATNQDIVSEPVHSKPPPLEKETRWPLAVFLLTITLVSGIAASLANKS